MSLILDPVEFAAEQLKIEQLKAHPDEMNVASAVVAEYAMTYQSAYGIVDLAKKLVEQTVQPVSVQATTPAPTPVPAPQQQQGAINKPLETSGSQPPAPVAQPGPVTTALVPVVTATAPVPPISPLPLEGARAMVARGIPVHPLKPGSKEPIINAWQTAATTDEKQIQAWANEYPNCNWGDVARAEPGGTWFFEVDRPGLIQRIEAETGRKFPKTLSVRSRAGAKPGEGRGHIYFRHNAASIALAKNKAYISFKDDQGEVWSARLDRSYVVAPGSIHPDTGKPYQMLSKPDQEIMECPDWLIEWIKAQQAESEKMPVTARLDGPKIPRGSHDNELTRIAGKLRWDGMEEDSITDALIEICEKRCEDYGPDYQDMCRKIAHSVMRYPVGPDTRVLHNGVPVGPNPQTAGQAPAVVELPEINVVPYPKFPDWIYKTPGANGRLPSVYTGLVKPFCDRNSRYEEFMLLPAWALLLNYLGTKVHIEGKHYPLSIFMIAIGEKGRVIKSSSVRDAIEYFRLMGVMDQASPNIKTADSKSLVWTAGSPEGLGLDMNRSNCKNAVLFYDELNRLVKKSQIECSTMGTDLLTLYEGDKFQNLIKRAKESYSIEAGTYCATFISCTTTKNFNEQWSALYSGNDGLLDRFFFLLEPEQLKTMTPMEGVNFLDGTVETKKLIGQAVLKGTYAIDPDAKDMLAFSINDIGNRSEIRAEKWALAMAVDVGLDVIDADCVERGLALCKYELEVKRWLSMSESRSRIATAQQGIRRLLSRRKDGRMLKADLFRKCESDQWDIGTWRKIYSDLVLAGYICEVGKGTKDDPTYTQLIVPLQSENAA